MNKFLKAITAAVLCALLLISASLPSLAATTNPYGTTQVGCITNVEMSKYTDMGGVNYFESKVTSHIQGVDSRATNTYKMYGAVGTSQTRAFVYSMGSDNNLDFANHYITDIMNAFEKENPAWNALVAVNGDFFDNEDNRTEEMGETQGALIQGGDVYKELCTTSKGRGVLGFTKDGKVIWEAFGEAYQSLNYGTPLASSDRDMFDYDLMVLGEHRTNAVISFNAMDWFLKPVKNDLAFITPYSAPGQYGGCDVAVVKCDTYRRANITGLGWDSGNSYYFAEGEVVEIRQGKNGEIAPEGYIIIALNDNADVRNNIKVGTYVKLQRPVSEEWKNVESATGFKQVLLLNGQLLMKNAYGEYNTSGDKEETLKWSDDIEEYPHSWKCRTAIGIKPDGTPVVLVANKGSNGNLGASYYELAEQFKALGCTNAFLLDGGGSSSIAVRNSDGTFSTTFTGENGTKGRAIANVVILAVRDESVPLPEEDPIIIPTVKPETSTPDEDVENTDNTTDDSASSATDELPPMGEDSKEETEKGFFEAIFDAIKGFFEAIGNFFKSLFGKSDSAEA